ncbi:unnamed protein product [Protopolystoma xenopodis]|uniref:Phosphotransferase n=1 Tax=Protopolystoma xenopodis TaxID=117903 RepID=A0A3S5B4G7_9PLAT|nr:unnamed protein product [Protopolystoma xenopodis]
MPAKCLRMYQIYYLMLGFMIASMAEEFGQGTGTNAAYLEPIVNVPLLFQKDMSNGDIDLSSDKEVVINMEWGAFGDNGELDIFRSNFDKTVDAASLHPGKQL